MWSGYENVTTVDAMGFEFLDSEKAELWAPAAKKGALWLHGFFKFDWRDTFIKIESITKRRFAAIPPQPTPTPTLPATQSTISVVCDHIW